MTMPPTQIQIDGTINSILHHKYYDMEIKLFLLLMTICP